MGALYQEHVLLGAVLEPSGDGKLMRAVSYPSEKASGPDPVDGCAASCRGGFDDEEKLLGLAALGANGSDPAAAVLRDILLKMNDDQKAKYDAYVKEREAQRAQRMGGQGGQGGGFGGQRP